MKELILIRGLPGSGKTTLAEKLKTEGWSNKIYYACVEADKFFEIEDFENDSSEYKYDKDWLSLARGNCYHDAAYHMFRERPVIISNTFTQAWEMGQYVSLAFKAQYPVVKIIHCIDQYKSVHNVPEETMKKMKARFEDNETVVRKLTKAGGPTFKMEVYSNVNSCLR